MIQLFFVVALLLYNPLYAISAPNNTQHNRPSTMSLPIQASDNANPQADMFNIPEEIPTLGEPSVFQVSLSMESASMSLDTMMFAMTDYSMDSFVDYIIGDLYSTPI